MKSGAEGVYCGALPERGLGFAVKIDDGATRAAETVAMGVARFYPTALEAGPSAQLLDLGHFGAQREGGQQAIAPRWRQRRLDPFRAVARVVGKAERGLDLPAPRAASSNAGWKPESATPTIAAITSRSDLPRRSATPYSVTTISRSCRGTVALAYATRCWRRPAIGDGWRARR